MAQDSARPAGVEQPKPDDDYAALLTRVQAGDAAVDWRAFRIAGVLRFPHQASVLEAGERRAFSKLMAAGDVTGALDAAKQALDLVIRKAPHSLLFSKSSFRLELR